MRGILPATTAARTLRASLTRGISSAARPAPSSSSSGPSSSSASAQEEATPKPKELPRRTPTGTPINAPVSAGGPGESAAYCASLVRRLDPDAWLTSYFWPRREKEWWLAIRAFNLELHLIITSVSQPAIAAMRFQFWRDALSAIYSGKPAPQHPVALALEAMHKNRPVQKYYLSQLIETRAKMLTAPTASHTLEGYLTAYSPLSGALLQGPLPIVLAPSDPATAHIAHTLSHIAHLLTVSSLIRQIPTLVQKRQLNIPSDVAAAHGVVDEEVFRRGAAAPGMKDAIFQIATRGMDELITARRDLKETNGKVVPKTCMPLFLSAVPAERYLHRLEKADFDVFAPEMAKHDWQLAPRIWWAAQRGVL